MSPARYDILVLDDGELTEIRSAAATVGAAVHSDIDAPGTPISWPLVVTSPKYVEQLDGLPVNLNAKRLVVLDHLSHTLRARMKRSRVDFFLRRPVHPEALRLLLLHCLYRGPERRRRRVAVGVPVRFRVGFRRGAGVLADLSEMGCRILTDEPLAKGARPLVFLPRPDNPDRTFYVRSEVVRIARRVDQQPEMALKFKSVGRSAERRIGELMALYDEGPAVFRGRGLPATPAPAAAPAPAAGPQAAPVEGPQESAPSSPAPAAAAASAPAPTPRDIAPPAPRSSAPAPPIDAFDDDPPTPLESLAAALSATPDGAALDAAVEAALAPQLEEGAAGEAGEDAPEDRRREPRREFQRQVVALDRSATRVLVGRDLSVGGMRVEPNDVLTPRRSFRLSIHVREGELPLVLRARVARDDGEEGVLLRFDPLSFPVQEQLRKSLRELPILASGEDGEPEAVLLSEILDDAVSDPLEFGESATA